MKADWVLDLDNGMQQYIDDEEYRDIEGHLLTRTGENADGYMMKSWYAMSGDRGWLNLDHVVRIRPVA